MRQIQISLSNEPKSHTETLIKAINDRLNIRNMILLEGRTNSLIIIRSENIMVSKILEVLNEIGVGI